MDRECAPTARSSAAHAARRTKKSTGRNFAREPRAEGTKEKGPVGPSQAHQASLAQTGSLATAIDMIGATIGPAASCVA